MRILLLKLKHYYLLLGGNRPSSQISCSFLCFKTTKLIYAHYKRFKIQHRKIEKEGQTSHSSFHTPSFWSSDSQKVAHEPKTK